MDQQEHQENEVVCAPPSEQPPQDQWSKEELADHHEEGEEERSKADVESLKSSVDFEEEKEEIGNDVALAREAVEADICTDVDKDSLRSSEEEKEEIRNDVTKASGAVESDICTDVDRDAKMAVMLFVEDPQAALGNANEATSSAPARTSSPTGVGAHRISPQQGSESLSSEREEEARALPPVNLQRHMSLSLEALEAPPPPMTSFDRCVSQPLPMPSEGEPSGPLRDSFMAASLELLFGSSDIPFLEATLVEEEDKEKEDLEDNTGTGSTVRSSSTRLGSSRLGSIRRSCASSIRRSSIQLRSSSVQLVVHATPLDKPRCSCSHALDWCGTSSSKRPFLVIGCCLLVLPALVLGLGLGLSNRSTESIPTLQRVQERGVLHCGVGSFSPGLNFVDKNGVRSGFDVALCHALAAAILGGEAKVDFQVLNARSRFQHLLDHQVDVLISGTTHTMQREVYEASTQVGFSFSSPYLYEGLQLAGDPKSVDCVENNFKNTRECAMIMVCVIDGSSHHAILSRNLPGRQLHIVDDSETMIQAFIDRKCGLIAHEGHQLYEESIRDHGYRGGYMVGEQILSKEPLCAVSRKDDLQWSSFVDAVLQGLLIAEKHSITKVTAGSFPQTQTFGDNYRNMFRHSIAVEGNYGELYAQYLEPVVPRKKVNMINDNSQNLSGLLYSHPFGNADSNGNPVAGYMEHLQLQGKVRCGIIPERPGFAAVTGNGSQGIEIDLCRAMSAALFAGFDTQVELVLMGDEEEGFAALAEGLVDVFAGASWAFQTNNDMSGAGKHVSFSPPYFYNNTAINHDRENLCLATSASYPDWSSFVYWIVMGIIQAEENAITIDDSNSMPEVNLFGLDYSRMLRDTILAVGNYGEVYNRSLQELYPRQGRNLLNSGLNPGPQHYALPGLF